VTSSTRGHRHLTSSAHRWNKKGRRKEEGYFVITIRKREGEKGGGARLNLSVIPIDFHPDRAKMKEKEEGSPFCGPTFVPAENEKKGRKNPSIGLTPCWPFKGGKSRLGK